MHTPQLTGFPNRLSGAERWAHGVMEHIALHQEVEALTKSIMGQLERRRLVTRQERDRAYLTVYSQRLARLQYQRENSGLR